jgi:two-component system sensor histidine kinase MprB
MKLRTRFALIAAVAVAAAVMLASFGIYLAARRELHDQVDASLTELASQAQTRTNLVELFAQPFGARPFGPRTGFDVVYYQFVNTDRNVIVQPPDQEVTLPFDAVDQQVAAGIGSRALLRDITSADGEHLRLITAPVAAVDHAVIQIARSLDEVDGTLSELTVVLALLSAGGVAVAVALGLLVARGALRPIAKLTSAAEHVAATQELAARIDIDRDDEVGRLAASFNAMLAALEQSRAQQRRLVRDAGHELRTPLTALRTNLELLARAGDMAEADRRRLLDDVMFELGEMSDLMNELVDLAADTAAEEPQVEVRLDLLVEDVAERFRRRTGRHIDVSAEPVTVEGRVGRLERAVSNLVDNAVKWSPDDGPIDIVLAGGRLAVRDHGPGVLDADKDHIFDRFFRSDTARSTPGSGLGLSIVKQVAEEHGGTVFVEDDDGGGAVVGFELPAR